jgi:hypothetical protein
MTPGMPMSQMYLLPYGLAPCERNRRLLVGACTIAANNWWGGGRITASRPLQ